MEPGGSSGTGNNSSNNGGGAGRRFTFPGNFNNKQQPQSQQNADPNKSNPKDLNKDGNDGRKLIMKKGETILIIQGGSEKTDPLSIVNYYAKGVRLF